MAGAAIGTNSGTILIRAVSGPIRATSGAMLIRAGLRTLGLALAGVFLFGSAAEAQLNSRRGGVAMVARLQDDVAVQWKVQLAARTDRLCQCAGPACHCGWS